ncbi:coiled-coil domain-containing protein [Streptomonospora nanhaiensis]|uniref:TolA-binding protein n=1 Tax=Streptomonospora nanhaiensis TaxID=1323731 RepID=A0A853BWD0_9ACTN|nr:hypothetical protein [Streptomonospora nanhaiensis]MBV2364833.1 hypothetical protein [Streptomonospora nanhaiensis]MBX9387199.1 hypothetical protein [Streptomonospora nanhaiensis]NYI98777.1 TolA-binding protein [Streptomonospora nanhaiensis]
MEPDRSDRARDFADFWAPDPPCPRDPAVRAGRPRRPASAVLAACVLAGGLASSPASQAAPLPVESLEELRERSDALSEEYRGELRDMEGVIEAAEAAEERADATREEVDDAREQVRELAAASYANGGIDPAMAMFVEDDPQSILDQAQLVGHLSNTNQDKIDRLQQAIERDEKARDNAEEKLEAAEEDLEELESRRSEVQELIADYPAQEMGGPYNLTPRTEQMRELVIEEFGESPETGGVGCYRPVGGWVVGEHPKGRACDFMLNANGEMPSQDQIDRGYAISKWAQDNAERLGIMYIIYRQQIWDVRRGDEGWRDMSDRGSITENHFDHVHISMF